VLVALIALLMLGALAVTLSRRRAAAGMPAWAAPVASAESSPPVAAEGVEAARLAREIAELDAAHERNGKGGTEVDESYHARRAELKRALAAELDARRGRA